MVSMIPISYENPASFDANFYMQQNPDLAKAGVDTAAEALAHYMNYGKSEGRIPNPTLQMNVQTQAPGTRPLNVASFSQPQQEALYSFTQAPAPIDPRYGQALDSASAAIGKMTTPYDPNSYQQYLNPFLSEVVAATENDINRMYDTQRQTAREDLAAGGAFGSSAMGRAYSDLGEAQNRQLGSQLSTLRAGGFQNAQTNAMDAYKAQQANQAAQASQYLNLGSGFGTFDEYGRGVQRQGLTDKLAAGNQIQGQNQNVLDAYFNDVNREIQYPQQQNQFLQTAINAYPMGQTQTQTTPGVGQVQGAIGGAMLGSGFNDYFNQGNNPYAPSGYGQYTKADTTGNLPWQKAGASFPQYTF